MLKTVEIGFNHIFHPSLRSICLLFSMSLDFAPLSKGSLEATEKREDDHLQPFSFIFSLLSHLSLLTICCLSFCHPHTSLLIPLPFCLTIIHPLINNKVCAFSLHSSIFSSVDSAVDLFSGQSTEEQRMLDRSSTKGKNGKKKVEGKTKSFSSDPFIHF